MAVLIDTCQISPPPQAAVDVSFPLTFLDLIWLHFFPIRRLLFYNHPCSAPHFISSLLPQLKHSLSLTLKHFSPLAGNIICPLNPDGENPFLRYTAGDAVPLTVSVSTADFNQLIGNHPRDADQFYEFVPKLPPISEEPNYKIIPVFAIQVTLFPDHGICIGFSNHHSLGDARSITSFITSWADVARTGEETVMKPPIFNRSVANLPSGIETIFWEAMRNIPLTSSSFPLPTDRVRATYTLRDADIKKLKDLVRSKKPNLIHVSSFVVTTSYIWTCLLKSDVEEIDENVLEFFIFAVDARGIIEPSVPGNYFGNCLSFGMGKRERRDMVTEEGFLNGAEAIGEEIQNRERRKDELFKGADKLMSEKEKFVGIRTLGVSGSPKFDVSDADFGWGRVRKLEVVSIDGEKYSMSLCKAFGSELGLEVGLSLPRKRMEAFATIFNNGLKNL